MAHKVFMRQKHIANNQTNIRPIILKNENENLDPKVLQIHDSKLLLSKHSRLSQNDDENRLLIKVITNNEETALDKNAESPNNTNHDFAILNPFVVRYRNNKYKSLSTNQRKSDFTRIQKKVNINNPVVLKMTNSEIGASKGNRTNTKLQYNAFTRIQKKIDINNPVTLKMTNSETGASKSNRTNTKLQYNAFTRIQKKVNINNPVVRKMKIFLTGSIKSNLTMSEMKNNILRRIVVYETKLLNERRMKKKEEQMSRFANWRKEIIHRYYIKSLTYTAFVSEKSYTEVKNLLDLPMCMDRVTWEFCACNPNCVSSIKSKLRDEDVIKLDLKKNGASDELDYNNCNFLRYRYNSKDDFVKEEGGFYIKRSLDNNLNCEPGKACKDLIDQEADLCSTKPRQLAEYIVFMPPHLYRQNQGDIPLQIKKHFNLQNNLIESRSVSFDEKFKVIPNYENSCAKVGPHIFLVTFISFCLSSYVVKNNIKKGFAWIIIFLVLSIYLM